MSSRRSRRRFDPGDVVVMDDLAAHKMAGIEEAIAAVGVSPLYLPPYSPDLNPIEQFFAKLKALLRKAAARTKEALWRTAGQVLDLVSSAECQIISPIAGYELHLTQKCSRDHEVSLREIRALRPFVWFGLLDASREEIGRGLIERNAYKGNRCSTGF